MQHFLHNAGKPSTSREIRDVGKCAPYALIVLLDGFTTLD